MIETCYGPVEKSVINRAAAIKLLICDVDGVLSNGYIYLGNHGEEEFKTFHARDGYGIRCLLTSDIEVAIITGRQSNIVERRTQELGIKYCYQGKLDKLGAFDDVCQKTQLQKRQIAYIGDDLIDLPVMKQIGLSVAVHDAHPLLIPHTHYVTKNVGGHGAVRELCDLILFAQHKLEQAKGWSI